MDDYTLKSAEKQAILRALRKTRGNKRDAASLLECGKTTLYRKIDLYKTVVVDGKVLYLDDLLQLDSANAFTAPIDDEYSITPEHIIVRGAGCDNILGTVGFVDLIGAVQFDENLNGTASPCTAYIGVPFASSYTPTRPFKRDKEGVSLLNDRIRVRTFTLSLTNTLSLDMEVTSPYYDTYTEVFNPDIIGSEELLGDWNTYTGLYRYTYGHDANDAEAKFRASGYLGATISGISWQGQYTQVARGI